jgi:hypothetical protein
MPGAHKQGRHKEGQPLLLGLQRTLCPLRIRQQSTFACCWVCNRNLCPLRISKGGTRGPLQGRYGHKGTRRGNSSSSSSSSSAILRSKQQRHKAPGEACLVLERTIALLAGGKSCKTKNKTKGLLRTGTCCSHLQALVVGSSCWLL